MYNIIQFGVGGTGCHLTHFLAPYTQQRDDIKKYTLVDGDIVEEKNLFRQNFIPQHVGYYKSEVIGQIYNLPYITEYVKKKNIKRFFDKDAINIVIGCVDTVKCRLMVDDFIKKNMDKYPCVYIDGGNMDNTGQVIIYDYINNMGQDISEFFQNKEYLDKTISCSEIGDQTILANFMIATYLFTNICFYIENKEIKYTHYIMNKHMIQAQ